MEAWVWTPDITPAPRRPKRCWIFSCCRYFSHVAEDWVSQWLKGGYSTRYRLMCDEGVGWRRVLVTFESRTLDYIAANSERSVGSLRCWVVNDIDIAKSGMRIEKNGRVFTRTEHNHIVGFKGLLIDLPTASCSTRWTSLCKASR